MIWIINGEQIKRYYREKDGWTGRLPRAPQASPLCRANLTAVGRRPRARRSERRSSPRQEEGPAPAGSPRHRSIKFHFIALMA